MTTSKRLVLALLFLISTGLCSDSENAPAATPVSLSSTVVKVCPWGEVVVCTGCRLTFSWAEQDILYFKMSNSAGAVTIDAAPASCSVSER